jgi:hypothetical protein
MSESGNIAAIFAKSRTSRPRVEAPDAPENKHVHTVPCNCETAPKAFLASDDSSLLCKSKLVVSKRQQGIDRREQNNLRGMISTQSSTDKRQSIRHWNISVTYPSLALVRSHHFHVESTHLPPTMAKVPYINVLCSIIALAVQYYLKY